MLINGVKVYLAHQVDDFCFAFTNLDTINKIIIKLQSNGIRICIVNKGTFNGADVTEYSETVKVYATSYINKLGSKIGTHLISIKLPKQVCTNSQLRTMTTNRNVLSDHKLCKLELKYGFKYRTATGMILFAYVLCHLDISFLIIILSKYNH